MFNMNHIHRTRQTPLRCVWVPSHIGAHATLTAVWIETAATKSSKQDSALLQESDSWLRAA